MQLPATARRVEHSTDERLRCARVHLPEPAVGHLEPGAEASFLVLERDPLRDFDAVRAIRLRVKQGCILTTTTDSRR